MRDESSAIVAPL